jgi:hypothetical protein
MSSRECYKIIYQWNFKSNHGAKRSRRGSKYLEKGKTERELETSVLGELNPPKNSMIPWRNHKIATKGS